MDDIKYVLEKRRNHVIMCVCDITSCFIFFIQAITDEAVQYISQRCPKLHYLCLSNCTHLTDASLIALGQGCHNLR